VTEHTAVANRIQKLIESANIKLGQVASDVLGLSGRLMLRALVEGEVDAGKLAELAQGKLKSKKAELRRALEGRCTPVQRWVLTEFLTRLEELEAAHAKGTFLQAKYQRLVKRMPKQKALGAVAHRLLVISYYLLSRRVAYTELGTDYVDRQHVERQRRRLVERLEGLGVTVTIAEATAAA
jgi:ABC-type enterobactin transport system permease subunit